MLEAPDAVALEAPVAVALEAPVAVALDVVEPGEAAATDAEAPDVAAWDAVEAPDVDKARRHAHRGSRRSPDRTAEDAASAPCNGRSTDRTQHPVHKLPEAICGTSRGEHPTTSRSGSSTNEANARRTQNADPSVSRHGNRRNPRGNVEDTHPNSRPERSGSYGRRGTP